MADDTTPASADGAASNTEAEAAVFQLLSQYVKDLSFENPSAPMSVMTPANQPGFEVQVNVQVKRHTEELYAVELTLNAKAKAEETVLFDIELVYGGAFRAAHVPDDQLAPLLMIEAPRLLFPFARQVLASTSQAGGYPPLMMEPVDFAALYRRNLEQMAEAQGQQAGAQPN